MEQVLAQAANYGFPMVVAIYLLVEPAIADIINEIKSAF